MSLISESAADVSGGRIGMGSQATSVSVVIIVVVFEEDFAIEAGGLFGVVLVFDFGEFHHDCGGLEGDGRLE